MKGIFVFLLLFASATLFSQDTSFYNKKNFEDWRRKSAPLKTTFPQRPQTPLKEPPFTVIPNKSTMSVVMIDNAKIFNRNNGNGGDIYIMKTDNMPCLMADSTFKANMPVIKFSGELKGLN